MVGLVGLPDRRRRAWRQVMLVGRLRVVHERFMMRNIVARRPREAGRYSGAHSGAIRQPAGRSESTLKPTPGDALGVQQVANILARHMNARLLCRADTGVETQSSNSGRGSPMTAPEFKPPAILPAGLPGVCAICSERSQGGARGVAGNQVDRTRC